MRCLDNGLWLCRAGKVRYAVVLSPHREHSREFQIRIEIVVPAGAEGAEFVQRAFPNWKAWLMTRAAIAARSCRWSRTTAMADCTRGITGA